MWVFLLFFFSPKKRADLMVIGLPVLTVAVPKELFLVIKKHKN